MLEAALDKINSWSGVR